MFVLFFLFLSFFLSSARAEELPVTVNVTYVAPVVTDEADYGLKVPSSYNGVSLVIGSDCKVAVVGKNLSPKKVGRLAGEVMKVKTDCLTAMAKRNDKVRADKVAADRSASEDKVLDAVAEVIKDNGSVDLLSKKDGELHLVTGHAAEIRASYQAYSQVQGGGGYVNSADWLRTQARIGLTGPQAQPYVVQPDAQPAASNSDEVAELRRALEAKSKLVEELSGS